MFLDPRLPDRFWSKVVPEPNSGCWLWLAGLADGGYGAFMIGSKRDGSQRMAKAHRHAYEALVAPVPVELDLDHLCRVRCCVNPAHLEPVTRRENLIRGQGVIAKNAAKTHCSKGHPYNKENTLLVRTSSSIGVGRDCRACRLARKAAARAPHKKAS